MTTRAVLAFSLLTAGHLTATACPTTEQLPTEVTTDEGPTTSEGCLTNVDFRRSRSLFSFTHTEGASGISRSGIGGIGGMYVGVDLSYGLQFGGDARPSYEIELSGGAALQRSEGATSATGVTTQAALRLGPAQMAPSAIDDGSGNIAFFPLTMELSHAGEIAGRPRMSARPELARSLFNRERVELATRIVRVEGAGEKAQTGAPGTVEERKPSSWAVDVIPLYAGLDIAQQDTTRVDVTAGGSLLGVVDRSRGASMDALRVEHRHVDMAMSPAVDMTTVWMLRVDGTDPETGAQYLIGWGELIVTDELRALASFIKNEESGNITVGGVGWFSKQRDWGGWGLQYKREPYVSMAGQIGIEDRVSAEVHVPRAYNLIARAFGARTSHATDTANLRHDVTAGVEMDTTYAFGHWSAKVGVEVGRTYYTALDNAIPSTAGFGAAVDVSVQHTSTRTWTH